MGLFDLGIATTAAKCSDCVAKFLIASPREGAGGGEVASTSSKAGASTSPLVNSTASNVLMTCAAAASGLALFLTGYYYWLHSDGEGGIDGGKGGGQQGKNQDQEESEQALLQARDALQMEWTQTCELNKVSKGTLGFEAWWNAADNNSKKALLQSARDLMRQRLLEHQPDAAVALDVLCPEIGDQNLDRLVRGNALVALIKLRISQVSAVRKHDLSFVKENLAQQNLEGKIHGVDAVEVLCDNRQLLMMTFLCDVLILCRHMGNFPKMLSEQEMKA
jgi:hypothetical protein